LVHCMQILWPFATRRRMERSSILPYGRTVHTHTHHRFKITLPNTDNAHDKISVNHYE
jgi:hypothetical protein